MVVVPDAAEPEAEGAAKHGVGRCVELHDEELVGLDHHGHLRLPVASRVGWHLALEQVPGVAVAPEHGVTRTEHEQRAPVGHVGNLVRSPDGRVAGRVELEGDEGPTVAELGGRDQPLVLDGQAQVGGDPPQPEDDEGGPDRERRRFESVVGGGVDAPEAVAARVQSDQGEQQHGG